VLVEIRDKVAALKNRVARFAEIVAAKPGARYDAEWSNLFITPSAFIAPVYQLASGSCSNNFTLRSMLA
jgi:hypothetical protein